LETIICKNCQNQFAGKYCNLCGEKVIEPREKTVWHFFGKLLEAFTSSDNKFFRSLYFIVFKPGKLSYDFAQGLRKPYFPPLSLFLLANLIYFLFPVAETFNTRFETQLRAMPHSFIARQIVENRLKKQKISLAALKAKYEPQSTNLAKTLLLLIVFLFAVPLYVLFYAKTSYFVEHLYFSFEFHSYNLFVNTIFLFYLLYPLVWTGDYFGLNIRPYLDNDNFFSTIVLISIIYFFSRGLFEFYQEKLLWRILKIFVLIISLFMILQSYRFILFLATMMTI
jgi:hypothetical protein